jgi:flagellar hook assembly protein FlgD
MSAPVLTGIHDNAMLPQSFLLEQNWPNPFNPTTTLKYALPAESKVRLTIYDVLGQVVATLSDGVEHPGYRSVEWNAVSIASGVYFYRLEATKVNDPGKTFTQIKKMLLCR